MWPKPFRAKSKAHTQRKKERTNERKQPNEQTEDQHTRPNTGAVSLTPAHQAAAYTLTPQTAWPTPCKYSTVHRSPKRSSTTPSRGCDDPAKASRGPVLTGPDFATSATALGGRHRDNLRRETTLSRRVCTGLGWSYKKTMLPKRKSVPRSSR